MSFNQYAQQITSLIQQGEFWVAEQNVSQTDWLVQLSAWFPKVPHRIFVIGNGGSATIASHFVVDCLNCLHLSAQTLHESAVMTCFSNDYGYENAFARQIESLAQPEDLLVVISSSGQSPNMVKAAQTMSDIGGKVLSLTGFQGDNTVRQLTQRANGFSIWLPSQHYGWVETAHQLILHGVVDYLSEVWGD